MTPSVRCSTKHIADGEWVSFKYDDLGRLTSTDDAEGSTNFTYDAPLDRSWPAMVGALHHAVSPDGTVLRARYDSLGRLKQEETEVEGELFDMLYYHNSVGQTTHYSFPEVAGKRVSIFLDYENGGLQRVVDINTGDSLWTLAGRDGQGRVSEAKFGNGVQALWHYDPVTGLLSDENASGGVVERSYTYAPGGIVAGHTDAVSGITETFTFDYLQRVAQWDQDGGGANLSTAFDYDVVTGNLMTRSRSAGGTVENTTHLTYEPNSHRPVRRWEEVFGSVNDDVAMLYDSRGRRTEGPWSHVAYTAANLPRTIEDKYGLTEFRYDAFGARVLKRGATKTLTTHGGAYRRVGDLHVMSVGGLAEIRVDTASGSRETFYQHTNYRGDTIAVTDESGDVVERRAYSPFGRRLGDDHRPVDTPLPMSGSFFGFTGHEHDDELGLINMRGRVFDPASSTFLTQDPIVSQPLHGPSWNGYSYVGHAPTRIRSTDRVIDATQSKGITVATRKGFASRAATTSGFADV